MKTIYKTKTECHSEYKYSHAYDEFGNYISREFAIKDGRKYYIKPDNISVIWLILKTSSNGNLFFSALPNQTWTDKKGEKHQWSNLESIFESYEHRKFKGDIVENCFFYYKGCKVLIENAKEEYYIDGTKFRSDVKTFMLDKTPCTVEVIKSSEISEKKQKHIEENQLLTFKIYIDDKGNQIEERDSIIGDREIESINSRIQDGQGKIAEIMGRKDKEREILHDQMVHEFAQKINKRIGRLQENIEYYRTMATTYKD